MAKKDEQVADTGADDPQLSAESIGEPEAELVPKADPQEDLADDTDDAPAPTEDDAHDGVISVPAGDGFLDAPAAAVLDPGPDPITPASSAAQHDARVKYEAGVNAAVEVWITDNRPAIIDAFLAGHTPILTTDA